MGREKNRVEIGLSVFVHIDFDIGSDGCEVIKNQAIVVMTDLCDVVNIGPDACDVGSGRKGGDFESFCESFVLYFLS